MKRIEDAFRAANDRRVPNVWARISENTANKTAVTRRKTRVWQPALAAAVLVLAIVGGLVFGVPHMAIVPTSDQGTVTNAAATDKITKRTFKLTTFAAGADEDPVTVKVGDAPAIVHDYTSQEGYGTDGHFWAALKFHSDESIEKLEITDDDSGKVTLVKCKLITSGEFAGGLHFEFAGGSVTTNFVTLDDSLKDGGDWYAILIEQEFDSMVFPLNKIIPPWTSAEITLRAT
ncbi:MAG: hypothetical protein LBT21_01360, partial [Oscillospiraceae bacterium]|nr:hypothetical protein [Oscillospiraceae bacterium]